MLQDFDFKIVHCLGPKHVKLMWMRLTTIQWVLLGKMKMFCKDPRCASNEKVGGTNLDCKKEHQTWVVGC
jgi:hypothetical protein